MWLSRGPERDRRKHGRHGPASVRGRVVSGEAVGVGVVLEPFGEPKETRERQLQRHRWASPSSPYSGVPSAFVLLPLRLPHMGRYREPDRTALSVADPFSAEGHYRDGGRFHAAEHPGLPRVP